MLWALLALRGIANVVFGLYWLAAGRPLIPSFHAVGYYALMDGALALAIGLALLRGLHLPGLIGTAFIDAVATLALALAVFTLPGIPYYTITFAIFVAAVAGSALGVGASALAAVVSGRGEHAWRASSRFVVGAALLSVLFGGALLTLPRALEQQLLVGAYTIALGATFLAAAVARPGRGRAARP